MAPDLIVRNMGMRCYEETYAAMSKFTDGRGSGTIDEIWFLQHPPIYTLGLNGQRQHIIDPGDIPIAETDRGGQVTYHGPGQLLVYLLIDIKRKSIGVKDFVGRLEQSIINMLENYGINGMREAGAPGVYVDHKKISALGIRIRRGSSYHGLSINVDMDLSPYNGIHPCGYSDLEITQLKDCGINKNLVQVVQDLLPSLLKEMDYSEEKVSFINEVHSDQAA